MKELIPAEAIERKIFLIRGQKVMLSSHLAHLYGVTTSALIQAVKRNIERFPEDFMFKLTAGESRILVSQNVIPTLRSFGGSLPYAFTEQGVAMLSSILRSKRAVQVNIAIMRAFVKLRRIISGHKGLARKLADLERKIETHDIDIREIFEAIRHLMGIPGGHRKIVGFADK
ncbi:ORF6N domain-containing protein [Candidatus Omnitrophota bacterium]